MGYYVRNGFTDISIPKEKEQEALDVLKNLVKEHELSWICTDIVLDSENLVEALREMRYECGYSDSPYDNKEYIVIDYFSGEKWGDDESIFIALAPFIADEGSIEFTGEDDSKWRYYFKDGKLKEQYAETIWKD